MATVVLDSGVLHATLWDILDKSPYTTLLSPLTFKEKITIDFLRSAINTIFASCEYDRAYDYVNLLAPCFDEKKLCDFAVARKDFAVEVVEYAPTRKKGETVSFDNLVAKTIVLPPVHDVVEQAYGDLYDEFVSAICEAIRGPLSKITPEWRYRVVELDVEVTRKGQISMFRIILGEDIRKLLFKEIFKNGRYDSSVLRAHNLPEPDRGFELDRSTGRVLRATKSNA